MRPRSCALVLTVMLALAGTATAATRALQIDRGVVQTVSATQLVLRELDGNLVTVTVGVRTRVRVNGLASSIDVVRPGFVATAVHDGDAPATVIRAFGRLAITTERGVVVSVVARRLTLRTGAGRSLVLRITARTRIRVRARPATVAALRPGRVADVTYNAAGEALRIVVRPRLSG